MEGSRNIWSTSFFIMKKDVTYLLSYCAVIVVIFMLEEALDSTSGRTIGTVFTSAILAIPAHLSVLSRLSTADAMRELHNRNPRYMVTFVFRMIALGAISCVPMFALIIILSARGWENGLIAFASLSLFVVAALVFAKWGTMLPAIVMQSDITFAAAGRRGSVSFFYAFPRLLLSLAWISIIQVVAVVISTELLGATDQLFPVAGGFDFALMFSLLIGAVINAYQIIMIAVILSRAYLRAEIAIANKNDLVPI